MIYRRDVDGLRAVAVVPVVLYHAGLTWVPGGFVGVDLFFVISGYLITSILVNDITAGKFSLLRFYERRIRRLFPALYVVLLATFTAALFVLLPVPFAAFSRSVVATVIFGSNILFWRETSYFGGTASETPLLHTWSLAVEEQFYLLFPLFLILAIRYCQSTWKVMIWPLLLVSFVLSAWMVKVAPAASFYLLPPRAWELLIGAVLAIGAVPRIRNQALAEGAAALGLVLIAWGVLTFSHDTVFPGPNALFPCFGAALILHAGAEHETAVGRLLGSRVFVGIGLISYSLYLWHWPVLVLGQIWAVVSLTPVQTTGLVMLSFGLAAASWRWVEQPFRGTNNCLSQPRLFGLAIVVSAVCVGFGVFGHVTRGLPERFPVHVLALAEVAETRDTTYLECLRFAGNPIETPCSRGGDVTPRIALWGDSHANVVFNALAEQVEAIGTSITFFGTAGCPPLRGVAVLNFDCTDQSVVDFDTIVGNDDFNTVIIMARFSVYVEGRSESLGPAERGEASPLLFDPTSPGIITDRDTRAALLAQQLAETVEGLRAAGKSVVLVYPIPETGYNIPRAMAQLAVRGDRNTDRIAPTLTQYFIRQRTVISALDSVGLNDPDVYRVHPAYILCPKDPCIVANSEGSLYRDDDHLSDLGARLIASAFASALFFH